jgi:acyl transferase domain-containing protein
VPVLHAVLASGEPTVFVEISPHPLLSTAIQDTIDATGAPAVAVGSLRRDRPQLASLLSGLGSAYVAGCRPAWDRVYRGAGFLTLPTYPWQRERYWVDPPSASPRRRHVRPRLTPHLPEAGPAPEVGSGAEPAEVPTRSPQAAESYLAGRVADTLQLPAEEVGRDVPLTLFGMDSMRANEIRSRIQRDLGVAIPATMLLRGATIAQLAARLSAGDHGRITVRR